MRTRRPLLVGPVDLVQGGQAFIYRNPVYLADNSYWGLVNTVVDAQTFLDAQAASATHDGISASLRTDTGDPQVSAPFWGPSDGFESATTVSKVSPYGAHWELAVTGPAMDQSALWRLRATGYALTLAMTLLVFLLIRAVQRRQATSALLADMSAQVPGMLFEARRPPGGAAGFTYVSEGVYELLQITPEALVERWQALVDHVVDADRDRVTANLDRVLSEGIDWLDTFRVRSENGTERWVHATSLVRQLADGTAQWHGSITDITEEMRTSDLLTLSASVFGATHDAILILTPDERIADVNPAFSESFGYSPDEIIGEPVSSLGQDLGQEVVFADLRQALQRTGYWRGELLMRAKSGQISLETVTISVVVDEREQPTHMVAVITTGNELREDFVTGLPSRSLLEDRLDQAGRNITSTEATVAVVAIGLDGFKEINTVYGHGVGDLLLRAVAERLQQQMSGGDSLFRMRGDEFKLVHPGSSDPAELDGLCARILRDFERPFAIGDLALHVTAGLGVAMYPTDTENPRELRELALQALGTAKAKGRASLEYYQSQMQVRAGERVQFAEDLRAAVESGSIAAHFQPIVSLVDGSVTKAETLARWHHPVRGAVSPGMFIPTIERLGMISELGAQMHEQAMAFAREMRRSVPAFQVSVNLSVDELHLSAATHEARIRSVSDHGLPPSAVVLEITESLLLTTDEASSANLTRYRDAGIPFSIDDFGTGYSSLAYLQELEVDWLKIDQAFTQKLTPGSDTLVLVQAIVVMAHQLGLGVIVEGVETIEQRDLAREAGCDYAQGFLYTPALAPDDFVTWLRGHSSGPAQH
ncbi:MAG: EAL domain-containing protein [Candidatus Nanopelagicales bacterium]|nr:EAL domain-containing protein [Candidatus Nanopelagicales bacterium]